MAEERRRYVRVSADCRISFRRAVGRNKKTELSYDQYDPISSIETSNIVSKIRNGGNKQEEQVLELLLWIDWKMNYLIKTLAVNKDMSDFPHEAVMVNLSASGMRFSTLEQTAVGAMLLFRFFLPILPFKEMILEGEVTRSRQKTSEENLPPRFEVGVAFKEIKASDQEMIFRYVAKRERQLLQAQREEEMERYAL